MRFVLSNRECIPTDLYDHLLERSESIALDTRNIPDARLYRFEVSFNGDAFAPITDNKIALPPTFSKYTKVSVRINQINLTDGSATQYATTQDIPVGQYFQLGATIETAYPKVISELRRDIIALERRVEELETRGDFI